MEIIKLESNIWKTYLFQTLSKSTSFFIPIIVLFWQDHGLSLTEVTILQSLFAIALVVFEVPSGYFADIFGRKTSLFFGAISLSAAMFVYSIGSNFQIFLAAEMLIALGLAFISGADSALLYDTLAETNRENEYKKIWGNITFYFMIGMAVFAVAGGWIAKFDLRYPLYVALVGMLLLIPISLSLREPRKHKLLVEKNHFHHLFKIFKETVIHDGKLKWLIIYSAFVYVFFMSALWFYQPYFKLTGLDIAYFGLVFAGFNILSAMSSKFAHQLEEKIGQKNSLIMLFFVLGVGYFLMGNFVFIFSFIFAFSQQFVRGFYRVVSSDYINQLAGSETRATILSIQSLVASLLYAAMLPIFGKLADVYGLTITFNIMGVMTLISGGILLIILHQKKVV